MQQHQNLELVQRPVSVCGGVAVSLDLDTKLRKTPRSVP